jgi:hypothetical protein
MLNDLSSVLSAVASAKAEAFAKEEVKHLAWAGEILRGVYPPDIRRIYHRANLSCLPCEAPPFRAKWGAESKERRAQNDIYRFNRNKTLFFRPVINDEDLV